MSLSTTSAYVYVTNGLTLAGTNGTGTGTINLTGQSADIYAEGGQTLTNATLNIGNANNYDYLYNYDPYGIAVLTLGASLTIDQVGTYAVLDTSYDGRTASGIVNAGTINAGLSGGSFNIQGSGSFTNQGAITVSNGDTLSLASSSWSNSGTIAVTGGTLGLQGNGLTLAQLGTVTHTGGVVNLQTTLNDTGTTPLNVGQGMPLGTLTLASSGTIENGTIVDQGSGIAFAGGTLSGVTYDGPMNLSTTSAYVYVTNGLTLAGTNGTGTGTINLTGQSTDIYAEGGQTLTNATLNIGNTNGSDYLYNYDPAGIAVLTLGASLTIDQVGTYAVLDTSYDGRTASGIVNAGTINAGLSGGSINIQGSGSFTNQGAITVSNGDTLSLASSSWSNSGTIAVTGGTLGLQGNGLTLAQLGTVTHTGGVVNLQTTLNDTGTTPLNVGQGMPLGTLTLASSGTIENGTIVDQGSGIAFAGGTLSGVTYDGTMNLSTTRSSVTIANGLTLAGTNRTGTGTINLTGQSADIYAEGGQTLTNATLNIGNANNYTYLYNYDPAGIAVLTLGASLTIDQVGTYAVLDTSYEGRTASGIVNAGTINAGLSGGSFNIQGSGSFTNQGAITVSNGDTLSLASSSWSNSGTIAVTGGTLGLQGNGLTLAQLGTVTHTGGVVNLQTTLNDTGTTPLNVGQGMPLGTLTLASSGTIENGTIVDQGSGIAFAGGTLSGVTYDGPMNLSTTSAYVYVTNGLTLAGTNGTGTGTINLTGQSTDIYAEGGQTLTNATLNIGNTNGSDYLYNYDPAGIAVLTLGASLTIDQVGTYAVLDTSYDGRTASGIVNAGTINAGLSG